jgi:hypothetical protein
LRRWENMVTWLVLASTFQIRFLSVVFISSSIFSIYLTYLSFFHPFTYFIYVFIRVFSFVYISDRFACYSSDYHHSFVFACFLVLLLLVIYTNLDCAAIFGVGLSSIRR